MAALLHAEYDKHCFAALHLTAAWHFDLFCNKLMIDQLHLPGMPLSLQQAIACGLEIQKGFTPSLQLYCGAYT